ncbi:MmgE/PrpD family protein [Qaidamihabitans albus]|uniref:MmgE/PrpD family protein n=1 Tax=Qaidamihabitans albus TaxID=2795733 RepID=UPI0018F1370D|nr:MmgE/PrpD family protein [Qaidamihabitans albus]
MSTAVRSTVDAALELDGFSSTESGDTARARAAGFAVAEQLGRLLPEELRGGAGTAAAAATVAAAVAVAFARGCRAPVVTHAIGLAASSVGASAGDDASAVTSAAEAGLRAARLAIAGWDAPDGSIDGGKGLLAVLGAGAGTARGSAPGVEAAHVADLAAGIRWHALDEAVQNAAKVTFGNAAALMLAASGESSVRAAATALAGERGAAGRALGIPGRLSAAAAAFVQGAAGHLEDFDDTHPPSIVHPGAPVAAVVLALADATKASGVDALTALVAGVEAALLVGELVPDALARGWHMTGIAGPIGAAVAGALLGGANHSRLIRAIDAAASHASGLTEALGTLAKPMHVGNAAHCGVLVGFDDAAPSRPGGLARLLSTLNGHAGPPELGVRWRITENVVKPYACGVLGHSAIDLSLRLRALVGPEKPFDAELRVSTLAAAAMGRTDPRDGLASKFSVPHAFAVGYLFGDADPQRFSADVVGDARVRAIRDRVRLVADDTCERYEARLRVTCDGEATELTAVGPQRPTPGQVRAKAARLLAACSGADAFVDAAFGADRLGPLAELHELASGPATPFGGPHHGPSISRTNHLRH